MKGIILDLDGTVYLGGHEIPGAGDFVRACHQRDIPCLFVTNRSNRTPAVVAAQLQGYGIECTAEDIWTSSQATAHYLEKGSAYTIGEPALGEALLAEGFTITDESPDYVIVGFDRSFTYAKLKLACNLIHKGARFIATNPDHGLPLHDRVAPGTGALVAAVATGSKTEPLFIGKPERRIMDMGAERMGLDPADILAVGDNLTTDIIAGQAAGMPTALILTGYSKRADLETAPVQPDYVVETYTELRDIVGV
ncbi:MAG: HAD-IIA family hydrolase [Kiritimatiellia bacterium]|jgi:4-nitrophenyl phosphatase|nr:HAD-IIA family hydrolase [Kiritimatiellia bacterium]MDP6809947.1 HAD-IIA family hydrolase [Kiritimatiellia bacterium]MDP7025037.1 HAD-IIA family hydrolase [Kiritimatiellia bacterium]